MNQLQKSLFINLVFSGVSGIILFVFSNQISELFEISNSLVFKIIGIALILFALYIFFTIKKQNRLLVLSIIFQDFLWVIGSIVILIFQPFPISNIGNGLILIVALIVLFMGLNQTKALVQSSNLPKKGN